MFDKTLKFIRTQFTFKSTSDINDTVIIIAEGIMNCQIQFGIIKDIKHQSNEMLDVDFLILIIPVNKIKINLTRYQLNGTIKFQINGKFYWIKSIDDSVDDVCDKTDLCRKFHMIEGGKK